MYGKQYVRLTSPQWNSKEMSTTVASTVRIILILMVTIKTAYWSINTSYFKNRKKIYVFQFYKGTLELAGPLSLFHRTTGTDSGNLAVINLNFKKADVEHWAGFNLRTSNLVDVLKIKVLMTLLIKISALTLTIAK